MRYKAITVLFTIALLGIALNFGNRLDSTFGPMQNGNFAVAEARVKTSVETTGQIACDEILESSGVAPASAANCLWTHNDSGDAPRLFLISTAGALLATVELQGAEALDWEDMCRFTWRDRQWLLIADIGDNAKLRELCTLYLLEEPKFEPVAGEMFATTTTVAQRIDFRYPDGARDCESIAVAAGETGRPTIYLLSKEVRGRFYELDLPEASTPKPVEARFVAETAVPMATAFCLSNDGRRAVALTYGDACEFTREEGESWQAALARPHRALAMPKRRQGEAICFGDSANELWLTSEGAEQPIWRVKIP